MTKNKRIAEDLRKEGYVRLPYNTLRNISTPEDTKNNRIVYTGNILCDKVLGLSTDENVREYLPKAEGKKKSVKTQVHRAIESTLYDHPEDFSVLNGGLVIVARDIEVFDSDKEFWLQRPSIINGAQTQGVLKEFYETNENLSSEPFSIHIKFELIVTSDENLIGEISIARNFQNDVMTVSIVGRRKMFEELEERFQDYVNTPIGLKLRKKETDLTEHFVFTERLIQVLTALTPESLWTRKKENGVPIKSYAYSASSKCLKEYQKVHTLAKSLELPSGVKKDEWAIAKELYQFYLDIVGQAWELYQKWKSHQSFYGTQLRRGIERDESGKKIISVSDGIIFPILAALSVFAEKTNQGWRINIPPNIDEQIIQAAKQLLINVALHNPNDMGKSQACYSLLNMITSNLKR
jgi:AIPR protein